jgi:hypothetical protein
MNSANNQKSVFFVLHMYVGDESAENKKGNLKSMNKNEHKNTYEKNINRITFYIDKL